MSCGDWIIRRIGKGYAVAENHRCYAIILDKRRYGREIIEYIEGLLQ